MDTVSIEIAGNAYKIKTDDDPEYIKKLANIVTVKILEVKRDTGASFADCATMAALDFADRYVREHQKKKPAPRKKAVAEDEPEPGILL